MQKIRTALACRLRKELWLLEGAEKNSGQPFAVVYAGDSERYRLHFAGLAFREGWKERCLGREWLWRVTSRAKHQDPSCALVLYEMSDGQKLPFWGSRFLRNPIWLRLELRVDKEHPLSGVNYKGILRRIRNRGLAFSSSKAESDFEDFYHNMYVPQIQKRHKDMGAIEEYEALRKKFLGDYELVLIHQNGRTVAAGLWSLSGPKIHFHCLGVRDGDETLFKMGVVGALYFFGFQEVLDRGGGIVDLGHCRAFFGDGVFRHKLGFGARVGGGHDPDSGCLYFQFLRRSVPLAAFLSENPFVIQGGRKGYRGAVFMDKVPEDGTLDKVFDLKYCGGLEAWTVYEFDGPGEKTVRTQKGRRVQILPASSLLPGGKSVG